MIIRTDARNLPLADASVDLIVTSPPFYALRSYTDGGEHYQGQIGSEKTPAEYVDNLIACTREWMRVLKPSGSLWLNLGDKYDGGGQRTPGRPKSLLGLPWRYALRCIDELGLILRAEVIWSKPNGLPESVTDRVRRSHEQWFHFVRSPRYHSAVDTIRQPYSERVNDRQRYAGRDIPGSAPYAPGNRNDVGRARGILGFGADGANPLGALPGSVWEIPTQPLKVPDWLEIDHFAAFPMEWPRRIVQGWSPSAVCTGCGEGRRPTTINDPIPGWVRGTPDTRSQGTVNPRPSAREKVGGRVTIGSRVTITGEVCACPDTSAPTRPAVVLDPFGGTGTTALVAEALGRIGISVDMSQDYCRLATWRTTDPGQRAAAMQVSKPPVEVAGQDDLLDLLGAP